MDSFDYATIAKQAGLSNSELETIEKAIRLDYPKDDMLFELHVLRTCMAIRDKYISYKDV